MKSTYIWRNPKLSATSTTPFSEFISIPYSIFQLLGPYKCHKQGQNMNVVKFILHAYYIPDYSVRRKRKERCTYFSSLKMLHLICKLFKHILKAKADLREYVSYSALRYKSISWQTNNLPAIRIKIYQR